MNAGNAGEPVKKKNETSMARDGDRALVISRTFDAPARIVFDAWTKPELVKRWWAPECHQVSLVGCDADVRVGGRYRYVLRPESGDEFAFSGEYTEITPHTRLVYTQIFEPMAHAGAVVVTVDFEERDGKTNLVSREVYPSVEALEGALASGMETGMRAAMDQLDVLVASLR
jgi:uncharacterized protein YndB with AHSA1/START domain